MKNSLATMAVASLLPVLPVVPAKADVTLINVFEVPPGEEETVVAAWEKARDFLARQPGYVSTALHRAATPGARFQLINIAKWESPDSFAAATARMRKSGIFPKIEGLGINPALYTIIRDDSGAAD